MKSNLLLYARYHAWAFDVLGDAIRALDDGDYRADHGLFFGSVHGTLNHLLLADRVWWGRFVDEPFVVSGLDQELEPDRGALEQAVRVQAARWEPWIAAREARDLAGSLDYTNLAGTRFSNPLAPLLLHVFNHATHHRGQVTAVLTRLGRAAPELDLIAYLRAA